MPDRPSIHVSDPERRLSDAGRAWLTEHASRAAGEFRSGTRLVNGEIRAKVVGDAEMAAAHLEYCEIEGTTDVLTFDLSEPVNEAGLTLDVDILVCADEAQRQAAGRGHTVARELLLYIIHGSLHCLGHDDHDDTAFAAMHAEEDRILTAIGVGATFARSGGGGDA